MKKHRIAFCLNGPNQLNGPNVWLKRHLLLLNDYGLIPEIIYLSDQIETPCSYRQYFENHGVKIKNVLASGFIEIQTLAIVEAVKENLPDFFVPNYSLAGYYAARFIREAGAVTIGTLRSDDSFYHDLIDTFVLGPKPWKLTGVVCVSEYITDLVKASPFNDLPCLYAPSGAPLSKHTCQYTGGPLHCIYSGRIIEKQKRILRLTRRFIDAAKALPNLNAVMNGSGPQEKQVEDLLLSSDVFSRVKLGGELDSEEIIQAMLNAHVFVLLSDYEGLSIALMEAMACGLVPIVSNMSSGISDLIVHGRNGFIVNPDDTNEFIETLRRLSQEQGLWQTLSLSARDTIIKKGLTAIDCAKKWTNFATSLRNKAGSRQTPDVPTIQDWQMPPISIREDGTRYLDLRMNRCMNIKSQMKNRPLLFWGAGKQGGLVQNAFDGERLSFQGYIDSDTSKHDNTFRGYPVYRPETILNLENNAKPFIIITSSHYPEISKQLKEAGFCYEVDYI